MKKTVLILAMIMLVILASVALVSCYNETNALADCYKIAKDNGYTGSVDDFTNIVKALGADAKDIKSMTLEGNTLKLTLKDGTTQSIDLTPRDGSDGKDGIDGTDGKDGIDGADGTNGTDGLTPHIGENGNWWIGDKDTGIQAVDNTTYTVKFNTDHSLRPEEIKVKKGECIDLPTPTQDGYFFDGWYTGVSPTDKKFTSYDPVYRDMTLYARWIEDSDYYYTDGLTFWYNESSGGGYSVGFGIDEGSYPNYGHDSGLRHTVENIVIPKYYNDGINGIHPVKSIAMQAFFWCSSLKSIRIPDTITYIGQFAFNHCNSLETITLPDNATFSPDAFNDCPSLKEINISENNIHYINIDGIIYDKDMTRLHRSVPLSGVKKLVVPSPVKVISWHAFNGSDIEEVVLPDGLTTIEYGTFGYSAIKKIVIPESVTEIGASAFYKCKDLTDINLPNNLTKLGDRAFTYCESLETINLPANITALPDNLFFGCISLQTIENLDKVTYISSHALFDCRPLIITSLSDKLTYIGNSAFGKNSINNSLKTLIIPNSVTFIGERAFSAWDETQTIKFMASESASTSWDKDWKSGCKAQIIWGYQP